MRFGMFDILRWHKDWTAERAFDASLEQIEFADKLGLQDIWLGEHHFSRHGMLSGIFSFLGAVAAKTENARIGTAIVVLPFHNPRTCRRRKRHHRHHLQRPLQPRRWRGLSGAGVPRAWRGHRALPRDVQRILRRRASMLAGRQHQLQGQVSRLREYMGNTQARAEARPAHLHRRQHQP